MVCFGLAGGKPLGGEAEFPTRGSHAAIGLEGHVTNACVGDEAFRRVEGDSGKFVEQLASVVRIPVVNADEVGILLSVQFCHCEGDAFAVSGGNDVSAMGIVLIVKMSAPVFYGT